MTEVNMDSVRQFRLTKSTQLVLRALNLKLFSSIFLLLHFTCFFKDSFEKKVLKRKLWRRHFEKKVSKRMKRKCQILGELVLYRVRPTIKIWWNFCGMKNTKFLLKTKSADFNIYLLDIWKHYSEATIQRCF